MSEEIISEEVVSEEKKSKWYGPYEIASEVSDDIDQTVTLTFVHLEEGTTPEPATMDIGVYNACVTDEKSDLTSVRHKRISLVAADIMPILLKRNIYIADFEYLVAILTQTVNDSLQRAGNKLWGKEELDRTIGDVEKVLKSQS